MARHVLVIYLMCTLLMTCATARPKDCFHDQDHRSPNVLERLALRGAVIASSLRNLRSVRDRRWSTYPVWKSLHKIQERAMDIADLPLLPMHNAVKENLNADKKVEKDLTHEEGTWANQPFWFPEAIDGTKVDPFNAEAAPVAEWGANDWDYGSQEGEDSFSAWGDFIAPFQKCSDDIVGNPCSQNSDCQGCRAFHCSMSANRCVAGAEPDSHFAGFH